MRTQIDYNKVVNFDKETGEIVVLNYIFNDNGGFKGATGSTFEAVSLSEYNERTDEDNVIEYLIDSGLELPKDYLRGGFQEMYEAMEASGEIEGFMFDTSHSELWDELREVCGLSEGEAYIFNCTGGGRCFDKDFTGNVNVELSQLIREIEA